MNMPFQPPVAVRVSDVWKFCPACGHRAAKVPEHPFRCTASQCRYTHYFSPNTAVGALIVDSSGAMLFIVRGKDPGQGKLALPGGFVDAGEAAERSLIREIKEEVNLDVADFRYLASFPNEYAFRGVVSPVTDLFFVARVEAFDEIEPQIDEVSGWKFLPPREIERQQLAFDTHWFAIKTFLGDA